MDNLKSLASSLEEATPPFWPCLHSSIWQRYEESDWDGHTCEDALLSCRARSSVG